MLLLLLLDLHLFRSYSFPGQILNNDKELGLINIRLHHFNHFKRVLLLNSVYFLENVQVLGWGLDHVAVEIALQTAFEHDAIAPVATTCVLRFTAQAVQL